MEKISSDVQNCMDESFCVANPFRMDILVVFNFYYSEVIKVYIPDFNFVGRRVHIFLMWTDFLVR